MGIVFGTVIRTSIAGFDSFVVRRWCAQRSPLGQPPLIWSDAWMPLSIVWMASAAAVDTLGGGRTGA
jgi:hypothetical protein